MIPLLEAAPVLQKLRARLLDASYIATICRLFGCSMRS
jgi:hypothetical protein